MEIKAQVNPEAEAYISKMLAKQLPYEVTIRDCTFKIRNTNVYPPGKLTEMFISYLINNNLVKDKILADVGAGCFALGIVSAKQGAKQALGIDISFDAIHCARENIVNNGVETVASIFQGNGLDPLFPKYKGKIDLLLSGAPWDTLSAEEFNTLADDRKVLSRSFYDIDNTLISDVLSRGPFLLSPHGQILITASKRVIDRIKKLCEQYKAKYQIVDAQDLHQDGNIHYIISIKANISEALPS